MSSFISEYYIFSLYNTVLSMCVSEGPSTRKRCNMVMFLKDKIERDQSLREEELRIKNER